MQEEFFVKISWKCMVFWRQNRFEPIVHIRLVVTYVEESSKIFFEWAFIFSMTLPFHEIHISSIFILLHKKQESRENPWGFGTKNVPYLNFLNCTRTTRSNHTKISFPLGSTNKRGLWRSNREYYSTNAWKRVVKKLWRQKPAALCLVRLIGLWLLVTT